MNDIHYFPVTPDQSQLYSWMAAAPAHMLNLAVRIDIESELDEELFRHALEVTVERLPSLRLRLHNLDDGTLVQYISRMDEQEIPQWTDFTDYSEKKVGHQIEKWAGTAFPHKQRDVQLYHAELLRLEGGKHALFFCGFHIVMDISAIVYFFGYLDSVYDALLHGTELPREGGNPENVVMKRIAYLNGEKYQRDAEWWTKEFSQEPLFTSINGLGGKEYIKGKRYGRDRSILQMLAKEKTYAIPAEMEKNINDLCLQLNVSPCIVFLLALRSYLSAICETDDVSIRMALNMRSTLEEKSCGMTRANAYICRSILAPETVFTDALKQFDTKNRNYLKHSGVPILNNFVEHIYGCANENNYHSVTLSYVPFVDYSHIHLKVKATKIDSGAAIAAVYILLMRPAQDAELSMIYQYSVGYVKEGNIEKCHAFVMKFIEAGLNNPDKTLKELTEESLA